MHEPYNRTDFITKMLHVLGLVTCYRVSIFCRHFTKWNLFYCKVHASKVEGSTLISNKWNVTNIFVSLYCRVYLKCKKISKLRLAWSVCALMWACNFDEERSSALQDEILPIQNILICNSSFSSDLCWECDDSCFICLPYPMICSLSMCFGNLGSKSTVH